MILRLFGALGALVIVFLTLPFDTWAALGWLVAASWAIDSLAGRLR
jgi:hypothetical protein